MATTAAHSTSDDTVATPVATPAVTPAAEPDSPPEEQVSSAQMLRTTVVTLFLHAGLSVLVYGLARLAGATPFTALVVGAVIALARAGWVLARRREVDPFAVFMVGIYVFGLATSFLTGSPRFLLVKESLGTAAAGLAFVLTTLRGKPLAYHSARRVAAASQKESAEWEQFWASEPVFRHRFRVMSVVIGSALLIEAGLRIVLVFILPTDAMAVVSPIMTPVVVTLASIWAIHYGTGTEAAVTAAHSPMTSSGHTTT